MINSYQLTAKQQQMNSRVDYLIIKTNLLRRQECGLFHFQHTCTLWQRKLIKYSSAISTSTRFLHKNIKTQKSAFGMFLTFSRLTAFKDIHLKMVISSSSKNKLSVYTSFETFSPLNRKIYTNFMLKRHVLTNKKKAYSI